MNNVLRIRGIEYPGAEPGTFFRVKSVSEAFLIRD